MNTIQMYDAQAGSIRIEGIASNDNNRIVLRRIKRNSEDDSQDLCIQNEHEIDGEECVDYVPESTHDMGWLGYFIGKSDYLDTLSIRPFTTSGASFMEVIEPFLRGVNNNRSIHALYIKEIPLLGLRKTFTMLNSSFFKHHNLMNIEINSCDFGGEESQLLALALVSINNNSLESLELIRNNIANEGLVNIITALSIHPDLYLLDLDGNGLHKNGCIALSTLLQNSCTQLQTLDLGDNGIDDESLDVLVPALKNCYQLQTLRLSRNESITSRGWQQLASILEAPNSNLTTLRLVVNGNNLDDEIVAAFIRLLANNRRLNHLYIGDMSTNIQVSFSKLLCDTTSVNSTYLSNHTITYLGQQAKQNQLQPLLVINKREDKKEVAMIKILQQHNDINMMPFFDWKFKVLPLMVNWFLRASSITMPDNYEPNIEQRKLSSIYQFVRGMPLLYVETRLRKELEDIKAAQARMEERKRGILERLGRNA